ncbi:MAG: phosphatidate cytidylyltransferase [Actinomycetota bacterium]|nr:phosphatidate cytidylyltransferase [Actinomycetota bacterium]
MLKQRVLSAVIYGVILLGFLFLGRIPFFVLVLALVLLGLREFYSLPFENLKPDTAVGMLGGACFPTAALIKGQAGMGVALAFLIILVLIRGLLKAKKPTIYDVSLTIFGSLYVGFLLGHLILIYDLGTGLERFSLIEPPINLGSLSVLLVFVATWVYDTIAYGGGRLMGRRKLAPKISLQKTWEGTILGLLASSAALGLMAFIPLSLAKRILMGLIIGIAAVLGDLFESSLKRVAGVKDTGSIIPGHGGILDRLDSLLFTAPVAYYLLKLL